MLITGCLEDLLTGGGVYSDLEKCLTTMKKKLS